MLRADSGTVGWDTNKKHWYVRVKTGEEVIKRPLPKTGQDAGEDTLRSLAVETAKADGYELDPTQVSIERAH